MQLPLKNVDQIENLAAAQDRILADFNSKRQKNCYLISGPSFIGKSESALQLAKQIVDRSVWDLDIFSLDVQFTKVGIGELRQLMDNLNKTSHGKTRVCIIRCVEKLSIPASNSLLKTLEDTPKSVCFILTCSNEQKLLQTIKSRSQFLRVSSHKKIEDGDGVKFFNKIVLKNLYNSDQDFAEEYKNFFILWEQFLKAENEDLFREFLVNCDRKWIEIYLEILCLEMQRFRGFCDYNLFAEALEKLMEVRNAISQNSNIKLGLEVLSLKLRQVSS